LSCDEARLLIGADPGGMREGLEEHLHTCGACRQFRDEMRALDADILRALERPPQLLRQRRRAPAPVWRQWALAASVALAVFALLAVWVLRPSDTLAREVVQHVQAEPESWLAKEHVDARGIDKALRGAGVSLAITSDRIMYAESCWFRGHYVPHLVVQTAQGPATVMILRHEHVRAAHAFSEGGMTGVIVPDGTGSIAVLAPSGGSIDQGNIAQIAGQMQQDVHWLPQAP
jgi:uncharacterized protein DUF3379